MEQKSPAWLDSSLTPDEKKTSNPVASQINISNRSYSFAIISVDFLCYGDKLLFYVSQFCLKDALLYNLTT